MGYSYLQVLQLALRAALLTTTAIFRYKLTSIIG